jgi:hypothetical protein
LIERAVAPTRLKDFCTVDCDYCTLDWEYALSRSVAARGSSRAPALERHFATVTLRDVETRATFDEHASAAAYLASFSPGLAAALPAFCRATALRRPPIDPDGSLTTL